MAFSSKEDDQDFFQQAMSGVRRIQSDKLPPEPPLKKPLNISVKVDQDIPYRPFSIPADAQTIPSNTAHNIPAKQLRALQKGELTIEASFDTHGMTLSEAADQVPCWLYTCQQQGLRVVKIVHGQGRDPHRPSVKQLIRQGLLSDPHLVLAFCDPPASLGGLGATLILLKRKKINGVESFL